MMTLLSQYLLQEYKENGTFVKAHVPLPLARLLTPLRQQVVAAV
jgi:GTPase